MHYIPLPCELVTPYRMEISCSSILRYLLLSGMVIRTQICLYSDNEGDTSSNARNIVKRFNTATKQCLSQF